MPSMLRPVRLRFLRTVKFCMPMSSRLTVVMVAMGVLLVPLFQVMASMFTVWPIPADEGVAMATETRSLKVEGGGGVVVELLA